MSLQMYYKVTCGHCNSPDLNGSEIELYRVDDETVLDFSACWCLNPKCPSNTDQENVSPFFTVEEVVA